MAGRPGDIQDWQHCARWLVRCRILAEDHKVNQGDAEVFDLAQTLRDGVLICHLLNSLAPGAVDLRDFSQRPQMSQFLCLKNIRTFLATCKSKFGMREGDLFDPYDLFDMKDFLKVIGTLAKLSKTPLAAKSGIQGFTLGSTGPSKKSEDYYNLLEELATTKDIGDTDELYDTVTTDEHDEIYDDLCSVKRRMSEISTTDTTFPRSPTKRDYCIRELVETEKNYVDALQMVCTYFMRALKNIIPENDHLVIFKNIGELNHIHTGFHSELQKAVKSGSGKSGNISDCFIKWKRQFLIYGDYCSNLPSAQERIDELQKKNPIIVQKIKDCQEEANGGKFQLRDLLAVPMQRVLKYHLLLKELIKQTDRSHPEREGLENALEAMQDLSLYVNEVKRDSETLQVIADIQNSITDLQMPADTSLRDYGRLLKDGELRVKSHDENRFKPRHIFLFDKVLLMCKSRERALLPQGESFSYKTAYILSAFHLEEQPSQRRGERFEFMLVENGRKTVIILVSKTEEMKQKWTDAIQMALENTCPTGCKDNNHDFIMYTFEEPTECNVCNKLLRGVFYQGYRCQVSGMAVHKECIRKAQAVSADGKPLVPRRPEKNEKIGPTPAKSRQVIGKCKALYPYYGTPPPSDNRALLLFDKNDAIDLLCNDENNWWEGRFNGQEGYFPSSYVQLRLTKPRDAYLSVEVQRRASYLPASPSQPAVTATPPSPPDRAQKKRPVNAYTSGPGRHSESEENLEPYQWYVGELSRDQSVPWLERCPSGTYLIRATNNPQRRGEYSLSIKFGSSVKHIRVQRSPGPEHLYYLADCRLFRSIPELVEYYQENTLQYSFPELETRLEIPYKDAASHAQNGGPRGPPSDPCLGYALVSYDYAATAVNQLSLHRGDRVAILSKAGSDRGWWKGKLAGKVGYFPMNYVVEEGDVLTP